MDDGSVINFSQKKNELIERRKREVERFVFDNFLGVYTLIDETTHMIPIKIVNISENGCMFQLPLESKYLTQFKRSSSFDLRFYFTKDSYLLIPTEIKYSKESRDVDDLYYMRFGCEFVKESSHYLVLSSFIRFIEKFSENALSDKNNTTVLHL